MVWGLPNVGQDLDRDVIWVTRWLRWPGVAALIELAFVPGSWSVSPAVAWGVLGGVVAVVFAVASWRTGDKPASPRGKAELDATSVLAEANRQELLAAKTGRPGDEVTLYHGGEVHYQATYRTGGVRDHILACSACQARSWSNRLHSIGA